MTNFNLKLIPGLFLLLCCKVDFGVNGQRANFDHLKRQINSTEVEIMPEIRNSSATSKNENADSKQQVKSTDSINDGNFTQIDLGDGNSTVNFSVERNESNTVS